MVSLKMTLFYIYLSFFLIICIFYQSYIQLTRFTVRSIFFYIFFYRYFTLWYSTVLFSWLNNLNGIIFQVEINFNIADSVLLLTLLIHSLLKVCIKTQDLSVKCYPGRQVTSFSFREDCILWFDFLSSKQFTAYTRLGFANQHRDFIFVVKVM